MSESFKNSKIIKLLKKTLLKIDTVFNLLFTSKYNPLYSSGSIAFYLLLVMIITGVYLLIFYRVGAPYESVLNLQNNVFLGQFIRGVHRYASNLSVVAVVLHVFRVLIQKKYYGPRVLAWMSGIVLVIVLYVSAWTGYVLIWDDFAQVLAQSGALIFDSIGIFIDPISRAFDGEMDKPSSSFFFMNLFLHVVLPLLMLLVLWIHTSKMARASWLPEKKIQYGLAICLALVTVVVPLGLNNKANLLKIVNDVSGDLYFSFWLYWKETPYFIIGLHIFIITILVLIPWVFKPSRKIATAYNNPNACEGCGQCVEDCPYEAIQMFPRETMKLGQSETVAQVDSSLCIGCGICSGSCKTFTMGPDGKRAGDQLKNVRQFFKNLKVDPRQKTLVIVCEHQNLKIKDKNAVVYSIECVGQLHMAILEILAKPFKNTIVASCHPRSSYFKDSALMIEDRLNEVREPVLHAETVKEKVSLIYIEPGDLNELYMQMGKKSSGLYKIKPVIASMVFILIIVSFGKLPISFTDGHSVLRLSWRLAGQSIKVCEDIETDNQSKLQHMRLQQSCTRTPVNYLLKVTVNNKTIYKNVVSPGGFKSDRPHYVFKNFKFAPGTYDINIHFSPLHESKKLKSLRYEKSNVVLEPGAIRLIYYDKNNLQLK